MNGWTNDTYTHLVNADVIFDRYIMVKWIDVYMNGW